MLKHGTKYMDKINDKMADFLYDDRYKYYFGGIRGVYTGSFADDKNYRVFVSLTEDDEVIGFIKYSIKRETNKVYQFGLMNFMLDDPKASFIFARDIRQAIDDIFRKFNHDVMEWCVIIDNPIERSYDNWCFKFGGHITGYFFNTTEIDGIYHDCKVYTVTRIDYLSYCYDKSMRKFKREEEKTKRKEEVLKAYMKNVLPPNHTIVDIND